MQELTQSQWQNVVGCKFKLHFNVIQTVFSAIGAGIIGGPVGAGVVLAAAVAAQGAGNLHDMAKEELGNQANKANQ